jgi:hypothetical protein
MKLDKKILDYIQNADAYYLIAIKNNQHLSSIQGIDNDVIETIHKIVSGMLGDIDRCIQQKQYNNSSVLMILISEAIKRYPQFETIKTKSDKTKTD